MTPNSFAAFRLTRSGLVAPDIEQAITRSRPFAAAAGQLPYVVLIARRNEHGTDNYIVAPGTPAAGKAASALAAALGARADSCDLPELATTALAVVDATPSPHPSRITQAGADPTELAALFARAARPGQWVAISLRKPTRSELERSRRWWEHRLEGAQTHYHLDPAVMVATVYAGGDDGHELRGLVEQIMATVPGLDVETKVRLVGRQGPAAVGLGALGVGAGWATGVEWHHTTLAVLIGLVCAALGAAVGTGVIKGRGARLAARMARLGAAAVAAPAKRLSPPRRPGQRKQKDGSVRTVPGAYPLERRVLIVSPAMVIGLTSPQAGQESDVAATAMRHVPAALSADTGPMIGWAGPEDSPVHLDAAHFYGGTAVTGQPGSGKSSLLHSLWGWHCLERARPSGKPGRPGRRDTLVVIEPKPDGVPVWLGYAAAAGDEVTVVSLADPSTPAIDLFASPGTDEQRAGAFVEAMVYAWPAGDIQGRSYESLSSVFEAALAFEGELGSAWVDVGLPGGADVVRAAHCLLGGFDDGSAVALVHRLAQSLAGTTDPRAVALRKLGPLFGPTVTPSQRRTATESARNKTKVLVEAGSWWSPDRPKVTWDELLTGHRAVMLATGPAPSSPVSAKLTDHISAMATFALQGAIVRCCAGWQAEGRSVSIFVDELATVARSSSEVVSWLRAQGRSYGVRTFLATQYAEQLAEDVRNALLSSETLIVYRQGAAMAQRIAAQVATRGEGWSAADLTGLEQHTAVVLTVAQGQPQPPVPVRTAYWDDDPTRLAADQGYQAGATGTAAGASSSGAGSSGAGAPDDNDWLAAFRGGW